MKTGIDPDAQLVNQKVVVPTNIIRLRSSISPPPMSTTTSAMTVPRATIALAIYQAALLEADEALAPDHEVVQHCDVEHQHDRGGVRDVACIRCSAGVWSQALGTSGQDYYRIWHKLEGAFERLQESLINAPALDFEVMSVGALLPAAPSWTSPGRTAW